MGMTQRFNLKYSLAHELREGDENPRKMIGSLDGKLRCNLSFDSWLETGFVNHKQASIALGYIHSGSLGFKVGHRVQRGKDRRDTSLFEVSSWFHGSENKVLTLLIYKIKMAFSDHFRLQVKTLFLAQSWQLERLFAPRSSGRCDIARFNQLLFLQGSAWHSNEGESYTGLEKVGCCVAEDNWRLTLL